MSTTKDFLECIACNRHFFTKTGLTIHNNNHNNNNNNNNKNNNNSNNHNNNNNNNNQHSQEEEKYLDNPSQQPQQTSFPCFENKKVFEKKIQKMSADENILDCVNEDSKHSDVCLEMFDKDGAKCGIPKESGNQGFKAIIKEKRNKVTEEKNTHDYFIDKSQSKLSSGVGGKI
jgi:hypothetical protein